MPIVELYSMRNKQKYPDVYYYDDFTEKMARQIAIILTDCIGSNQYDNKVVEIYSYLHDTLCKEYGQVQVGSHYKGFRNWLLDYVSNTEECDLFLDIVELSCSVIDGYIRKQYGFYKSSSNSTQHPNDAIEEINERMKIAGFGYEYRDGIIMRIDDQFIHSEVVKPALFVLKEFDAAKEEFLSAHEHYRHGNFEECITDCCKSFESLMKNICHNQGWITSKEMQVLPAAKLIQRCFDNNLVPSYMQDQFASLKKLFESGVPTIRNKSAGHGAGKEVREIPHSLVSYTLHLTATNIVFLGSCYDELK